MTPKIKNEPIKAEDIEEFISSESDFAFELSIVQKLKLLGIHCDYSGMYSDPITGKKRQYDIRAHKERECNDLFSGKIKVLFAIECKNIREYFPLVIQRVERKSHESYINVISNLDRNCLNGNFTPQVLERTYASSFIRKVDGLELVKRGCFVGKSCSQVGRKLDNSIVSTDSDIYEKWTQCLNSANDFLSRSLAEYSQALKQIHIILPCVVVPDNRLWVVDYNDNGCRKSESKRVMKTCYFLEDQQFFEDAFKLKHEFIFSHIEFFTETGLVKFIQQDLDDFVGEIISILLMK